MGRPITFEQDQMLETIQDKFWDNGYRATSLDDESLRYEEEAFTTATHQIENGLIKRLEIESVSTGN